MNQQEQEVALQHHYTMCRLGECGDDGGGGEAKDKTVQRPDENEDKQVIKVKLLRDKTVLTSMNYWQVEAPTSILDVVAEPGAFVCLVDIGPPVDRDQSVLHEVADETLLEIFVDGPFFLVVESAPGAG